MIFNYEIKDVHVLSLAQLLGVEGSTHEENVANVQRVLAEKLDVDYHKAIDNYIESDPTVVAARESLATLVETRKQEEKPVVKLEEGETKVDL